MNYKIIFRHTKGKKKLIYVHASIMRKFKYLPSEVQNSKHHDAIDEYKFNLQSVWHHGLIFKTFNLLCDCKAILGQFSRWQCFLRRRKLAKVKISLSVLCYYGYWTFHQHNINVLCFMDIDLHLWFLQYYHLNVCRHLCHWCSSADPGWALKYVQWNDIFIMPF